MKHAPQNYYTNNQVVNGELLDWICKEVDKNIVEGVNRLYIDIWINNITASILKLYGYKVNHAKGIGWYIEW
jgi:hypothetical protein